MTINTNDLLNSILESISKIDYVKSIDIPNIDLYMDQVTTFMDKQMASSKRYEEYKVLTKTMINNYARTICFLLRKRKNIQKNIFSFLLLSIISKVSYLSKISRCFWDRLPIGTSIPTASWIWRIFMTKSAHLKKIALIL